MRRDVRQKRCTSAMEKAELADAHTATFVEPNGDESPQRLPTESEKTAAFMASRAARAAEEDGDDDDDEAEVLAAAQRDRHQRQAQGRQLTRAVAVHVERAEEAIERGRHMDAIGHYTEGLALDPKNVDLLAARGSLCARLNHHKATLHDGELIVQTLPDWHRGHALCGMALFCLKQYAPSVRAYARALEFAADPTEREGIRQALEQAQGRVDEELRQAALRENIPELERLLYGGGGHMEVCTSGGLGTAATAAATRHSAVNVEAQDTQHGFTALALATAAGRSLSAKTLIEARANVNATDKYGKTPLMWAAAAGNEKLATLLCKSGADLSMQDRSGWDAIFAAAHGGHTRLMTVWLLKKGADPDRSTADGTTALMAAAQAGKTGAIQLLLQHKVDPTRVNAMGQRALELARAGKHHEAVVLLLPVTPGAPPPPPPPINASVEARVAARGGASGLGLP